MEESEIKAIKFILAVLALGLLVAVGAAFEGHDGSSHGKPSHGHHDFGGFHDWLSPGLTIIIPIATTRPIPTPTRPITIPPTTTGPTHPSTPTLLQW